MKLLTDTTINPRTIKALAVANITTLEDVQALTEDELLAVKNLGSKSVKELLTIVADLTAMTEEIETAIEDDKEDDMLKLLDLVKTSYLELGLIEENEDKTITVIDNRGKTIKSYLIDPYSQKSQYGNVTTLLTMLSSCFYKPQIKGEKFDFDSVLDSKEDIIKLLGIESNSKFSKLLAEFKEARGYNSFTIKDPKTNLLSKTQEGEKYLEGVEPDIKGVIKSVNGLLDLLQLSSLKGQAYADINKYSLTKWEKMEKVALKKVKTEWKKNKADKKALKELKASL